MAPPRADGRRGVVILEIMSTTDRWARIDELFQLALEVPDDERSRWLVAACGGDEVIRADVASLLEQHEESGGFLEQPAVLDDETVGPNVDGDGVHEPVPSSIGPYRVIGTIGRGGMGVVLAAEDTRLRRRVALKVVHVGPDGVGAHRDRLQSEARAAAALNHPNIATIYALEEHGGRLYMASEFVQGRTLRAVIAGGPVDLRAVIDVGRAVSTALAAAHQRGIVHGDIKPENVMLGHDGRIKVLDFGLARFVDGERDESVAGAPASHFGTPGYMAPEQLLGQAGDGRVDIFALGVMLHELLSGVHPFTAPDRASILARTLGSEPDRLPDGADASGLAALIRRCLEKEPGRRYPSAGAVLRDLDGMADRLDAIGGRTAADEPKPPTGPDWWWQFHQAAVGMVYAALVPALWLAWQWAGTVAGEAVFFAGLIAILADVTLRWHLWFTWRETRTEWTIQRRRVSPWIRRLDVAIAGLTGAAGAILLATSRREVSAALLAVSVAIVISSLVIEPATTRAAFNESSGRAAP